MENEGNDGKLGEWCLSKALAGVYGFARDDAHVRGEGLVTNNGGAVSPSLLF